MKKTSQFRKIFILVVVVLSLLGCAPQLAGPIVTQAPTNENVSLPTSTIAQPSPAVIVPTQSPKPVKNNKITEALSSDAQSFQLYLTTDTSSRDYQFRVYASGLWQRDPNTNLPIPYMAESWTTSEDGKVYTFKLRKDMKWSDGVPITSSDFVWTFDQANKPENKYPYISILKGIDSYTATDDFTLVIKMNDSTCIGILTVGQITPLPKHTWENLSWTDPAKNPEIMKPSVVSGAWKLKEWKRDEYAEFVPNPAYFGGVPKVDSYIVRIIPQASIQFQMLKSGEVDFAKVSASDYADAKKTEILGLYSFDPAQPTWYFMGFNFKRPLLKDVDLRHALSYAIPRQAIADQIFNGLAKPAYTTFSPPNWAYNPDVPKYEYSIDTAKDILNKADFRLDQNGNRLDKAGNPIKLRIYYTSTDKLREQIALIAQEEFKKLGIASELIGMESKALFDFLSKKDADWEIWMGLARDTSDPYNMYQAWSESTIPAVNTGAYINKNVEDLFNKSNLPPCTIEARKKVFQQIQQIISTDSPYIFLVYNTGYAFANKRIVVNPPGVLGINYQVGDWYIP
jgi:peptide/nickel transport system substrate-binding protein